MTVGHEDATSEETSGVSSASAAEAEADASAVICVVCGSGRGRLLKVDPESTWQTFKEAAKRRYCMIRDYYANVTSRVFELSDSD